MLDANVSRADREAAADMAQTGFKAIMTAEASIVRGMTNKLKLAVSRFSPTTASTEQRRTMEKPRTGKEP
jgi:hypothetical protein